MQNGGVELIGVMQMDNRGFKERLIRAIFGLSIVPFVDVGVMEFIALRFQLVPLNTRVQDIQNVVEDFIERELRLWSCFRPFQMRVNVSVKVFTSDLGWNPVVDECRG